MDLIDQQTQTNGNQTRRILGAEAYDLTYDAENRLVEVEKNSAVYATFVYDGDGRRVKGTVNGVTVSYIGDYAEWRNSSLTSYYYAGAIRLAMRQYGELIYLFGDHLSSTSLSYGVSDSATTTQLYTAWGEVRYSSAALPTSYQYTGQVNDGFGLYFYNARYYDPSLGRWSQPDIVIPISIQGIQAFDRYAYVNNSPANYYDPTGHRACDDEVNGVCISWSANYVLKELHIEAESSSKKWDIIDAALSWLMKFAHGGGDALENYLKIMGDITWIIGEESGITGDYCSTEDNGIIRCGISPNLETAAHELTHHFDRRYRTLANDDNHLASDYLPTEYRYEPWTTEAFLCTSYACMAHPPYLPGYDWTEQFANMGQNWVLEDTGYDPDHYGFKNNAYGLDLRDWMDDYFEFFLDNMGI
jgi:RHS repeat-associated protein